MVTVHDTSELSLGSLTGRCTCSLESSATHALRSSFLTSAHFSTVVTTLVRCTRAPHAPRGQRQAPGNTLHVPPMRTTPPLCTITALANKNHPVRPHYDATGAARRAAGTRARAIPRRAKDSTPPARSQTHAQPAAANQAPIPHSCSCSCCRTF
eukprot:Tamp_24026.p3 GENE.Tamp_24026~~Tamp_24026.p3  ORF type:complete len:154 (-),score=5.05 Tamp_24026:341-802(-)